MVKLHIEPSRPTFSSAGAVAPIVVPRQGIGPPGSADSELAMVLRCFPDGAVLLFDHDLRYTRVGGQGLAHVGLTAELEGRTIFETYPPELVAVVEPAYRQALAGEPSTLQVEFDGRTYLQQVAPLRDAANWIVGGLGFTQDITAARHAEKALTESEERFRTAFDHAPIGKAIVGLDGRYLQVNRALCELLGYSDTDMRQMDALELTHPDDRRADVAGMNKLLRGELGTYATEKRYLTASGATIWAFTSSSVVRHPDGTPINFINQIQNITERKDQEQMLLEERRRLRAAHAIGHIGSWEMDVATRNVRWSNTLFELYGLQPGDFAGEHLSSMRGVHPDDVEELERQIDDCATNGTPLCNRHRIRRYSDGEMRWFDALGARHDDNGLLRVTGAVIDVTEQVLGEARLKHAALHDPLTGLPNRRLLVDRLAQSLDRSEREGQAAVLFCDLDGFKRINDVYGHHAGDAVLMEAASRMQAATRSGDTIGRMGGDEFVIICGVPRGEDPAALGDRIAGRIERAMTEPIMAAGIGHRVTVSTGVCLAKQGDDANTVLRNADFAMYLAKSRGKNGHAMFDPSLASDAVDRAGIEGHIRRALANDTLEVYYQPVVEPSTGRVRGVESLLRIPDGAGQHLDAFQVVTVAEQTGVIAAVGDRVLHLACAQAAAWRRLPGHSELSVSVNRSAAEIARPGVYDRITDALAASGLAPQALTIEITETVLLQADAHTIADLVHLRADGIGIAIDDFGTGYASLHYLATLPITSLKVDKSFTSGLPHNPTCATILSATVGLAADLGMSCVVEGVETIDQLEALPRSPKLLVQGYLYARPQAAQAGLPTHLSPNSPPEVQPPTHPRSRVSE